VANKIIDLYREMPANGPSSQDNVIFAAEIRRSSPRALWTKPLRATGVGNHQQGRVLELPTRAGLREVAQQIQARTRASFDLSKDAHAQHDNRMSASDYLSSLQMQTGL
jgi:hypothetical protein